ncbi:MAG: hypothetical protein ABJB03_06115 [Rhodoglobus sp.]
MVLGIIQLLALLLTALVVGVYWGPWIALTRTFATADVSTFLAVTHRMDVNLGRLMTVLNPVALVAVAAAGVLAWGHPLALWLTAVAFVALAVTTVVTVAIEVPIVVRVRGWTLDTMPADWQAQRDRWIAFHPIRVVGGVLSLGLLAAAAVFG